MRKERCWEKSELGTRNCKRLSNFRELELEDSMTTMAWVFSAVKPLSTVRLRPLFSCFFCRRGRRPESAKVSATTRVLEGLLAEQESMRIKSLKAAGDYFAINRSIWEKTRIKVNGNSGKVADAAALIAKKSRNGTLPF